MNTLNIDTYKAMMTCALENISARELEFSQLDAVCGDGDHGTAIVAAFKAVTEESQKGTEFKTMLLDMAMGAMMKTSGSTSTLIGALFMGMSDAAAGTELTAKQTADMFAAGLANVQKQTQAKVGDKTMMDALQPAVEAMQACTSEDVAEVLEAGAQAALAGAEKTIDMKAGFGRARNLGDRSIGSADPGATSWACMFESFAQACKQTA